MSTNYNRFGATYDLIIDAFGGTVTADYATDGKTGDTIINAVMDRISRDIVRAMPPAVRDGMFQVDCENCVRYASSGQTTLTLGMTPVLTGTVHLWRYPSLAAMTIPAPVSFTTGVSALSSSDYAFRKPIKGAMEVPTTDYAVTVATGAVTYATGLSLGERVFASYDVDVDSASFAMPSLADVVVYGAAAEMGAKLYAEGSQQWPLVLEYRARYNAILEALVGNAWVPDELRRLRYWEDLQPRNSEIKSARVHRS